MSDSDEEPRPAKKRIQPRPRRIARTTSSNNDLSALNSDQRGSESRRTSGGSNIKSPPSSQASLDDDDSFFMKTKNFRGLKSQASIDVPTEKDLEAPPPSYDQPIPTSPDTIPIFDFEDEARQDKEPEVTLEQEATLSKRKREVSLTPPPEPPKRKHGNTLRSSEQGNMFRPILLDEDDRGTKNRSVVDVLDLGDDDQDDAGLDPELASIAAKVSSGSGAGATDDVHQAHTSASQQQQQEPPKEVNVLLRHIRYDWENSHLHPAELARITADVKVAMHDTDPFKNLMQFYAMHKMLRPSDLIFAYKNSRLYSHVSPRSLSMPPVVVLDIYTQAGYKHMKQQTENERTRRLEQAQSESAAAAAEAAASSGGTKGSQSVSGDSEHNDVHQGQGGDDHESGEDAEFIFIKIRGKDTSDERMRVKKSTTIVAISNHYKRLKKLPESSVVKLEFDDETLDPYSTMADTEVEDDDMLTATVIP